MTSTGYNHFYLCFKLLHCFKGGTSSSNANSQNRDSGYLLIKKRHLRRVERLKSKQIQ